MNRSHAVAAVLVLLLLAVGAWWWRTFELKEVTRRVPLSGEARINPLFGLQRVLEARGLKVTTIARFRTDVLPAPPAMVVMGADLRGLSDAASTSLLDWVQGGGELVLALPPADGGGAELLEQLGLWTLDSSGCVEWKYRAPPSALKAAKRARGSAPEVPTLDELVRGIYSVSNVRRWCGEHRLQLGGELQPADFDWLYGNADQGWLLARLRHGAGRITFASQLEFLKTHQLRAHTNAALAWQLLAPALEAAPEVLLVYSADLPPLHVLVVRHGWPILLPLLLALLAWLWLRSERFGPLQAEVAQPRRALREHLRAAAELTLRRGQGSALLKPLRQRALRRLALSSPEIAALPAPDLARALAARHQLSPAAVELALFGNGIDRPAALAAVVRTLHRLSTHP